MGNFRSNNRGGFGNRSGGNRFSGGRSRGGSGGFGGDRGSGGFRGDRGSGGDRGDRRGDRGSDRKFTPMVDAVCDKCGKNCQLPFKPTGSRPVYCSECFGSGNNRRNESSSDNSDQMSKIEAKLDKIIAILQQLEIDTEDLEEDSGKDTDEDVDEDEDDSEED